MGKNNKSKRIISFLVSVFLSLTIVMGSMSVEVKADTAENVQYSAGEGWLTLKGKLTKDDVQKVKELYPIIKKVVMYNVECEDCSELFKNFSSLESVEMENVKTNNTKSMFENCRSLTKVELTHFDTSNVTNMSSMFSECTNLTELNVSSWDVSKVTDMSSMFMGCNALRTLDVANWNTSKVTDMSNMFNRCISLENLEVGKWDVSNVKKMTAMFLNCQNLKVLDVENWDVSKVFEMSQMFISCGSLEKLDVSNWRMPGNLTANGIFGGISDKITAPLNLQNCSFYTVKSICKGVTVDGYSKFAEIDSEVTVKADSYPGTKINGSDEQKITIGVAGQLNVIEFKYLGIFKVSYYNAQDTVETFENVVEGDKPQAIVPNPTKASDAKYNYTFEKWDKDLTQEVNSDMDVRPMFKESLRQYNYVLIFRDRKTKEVLLKDDTGMAAYGESIVKSPANINNYKPVPNASQTLEISEKENALYFDYARVYKVKFVNAAGETIKEISALEGEATDPANIPACPEKEATTEKTYKCLGWDRDVNNVSVNEDEEKTGIITIKPVYSEITNTYKYTVVYKCGDFVLDKYEKEANCNETIKAEDRTFTGYKENQSQNKSMTINQKDMVLTINYTKLCKASFTDLAGNIIESKYVEPGQSVEAPKTQPVKAADAKYTYVFDKWDQQLNNITGDVEFKPLFSKVINKYDYSIVYKCGENILDKVSGTDEYGKKVPVEVKEISGYKFKAKTADEVNITEKDNTVYVDYSKIEEEKENPVKTDSITDNKNQQAVEPIVEPNKDSKDPSANEEASKEEKAESSDNNDVKTPAKAKAERRGKAPKTADPLMATSMLLIAGLAVMGMMTALKEKEEAFKRN